MKRCRHNLRCFDLAVVFAPHESSQRSGAFGPGWGNVVGQCRCSACGEVLSLGHSDETPERVAIEIRAAEIAALRHEMDTSEWAHCIHKNGAEYAGWIEHAFDSQKTPEQGGEWAGWLAREIATHKETP